MFTKHAPIALLTTLTICLISAVALENPLYDLGGGVYIQNQQLHLPILLGSRIYADFTKPPERIEVWQDDFAGKITCSFPSPGKKTLVISIEDIPKATKRFYVETRLDDEMVLSEATSEWKIKLPEIGICGYGNINQIYWYNPTSLPENSIILIKPCDGEGSTILCEPVIIEREVPVVVIKSILLGKENRCKLTTWTQILAGKEN